MPWLETDVRDQRFEFVRAATRADANISELCRTFGISRKTGHKWLKREKTARSVTALVDRSRRPHRSPDRTAPPITTRVIALRQKFGWGGKKLVRLLKTEGITIAARTVDRIIQREGLTRSDVAPAPALTRFEREAPNELWQMDAKGHYPLRPRGRCHPLSILDDHSRFAVGLAALSALETHQVQAALTACFEQYGVPAAMLMDHGVPWWNSANGGGLTVLSVFLLKQRIRLLYGRVRHPQTQGKVERFHRTLGERLRWGGVPSDLAGFARAFAAFREEYNEVRPHEALNMTPPALRFATSARPYVPEPRRWEYAAGSEVHRVNSCGMVWCHGGRFFVSEALAGEEVACIALKRRIVVQYRNMYVRELHRSSGRSVPLWHGARE